MQSEVDRLKKELEEIAQKNENQVNYIRKVNEIEKKTINDKITKLTIDIQGKDKIILELNEKFKEK